MTRIEELINQIRLRFGKKKMVPTVNRQLTYEEVIRRYEELSAR